MIKYILTTYLYNTAKVESYHKEAIMSVVKCNVRDLLKIPKTEIFNVKSYVDVKFEDGVVVNYNPNEIVTIRHLLVLSELYPLIPIVSKYDMKRYYKTIRKGTEAEASLYTNDTFIKWYSAFYDDVDRYYVETGDFGRDLFLTLGRQIWDVNSDIYNNVVCFNQNYASTIDIESFVQIQLNPKVLKAMEEAITSKSKASIDRAYEAINEVITSDPVLRDNRVAKGYLVGSLKADSVKQIIGPIGRISEVDSTIYKIPITSSYLLGINDEYEALLETRKAASANLESTETIKESEYFARELQLATMSMERIVDGDCGSTDYIEWHIDENDPKALNNILGKYYFDPETNKLDYVKKSDWDKLAGKTIQLRTLLYCKLPDRKTICSKCFGKLANNINVNSNIGHYAAVELTERMSQGVLSTKHLITSANSIKINIKEKSKGWLYTIYDEYHNEKALMEAISAESNKSYDTDVVYITHFTKEQLKNYKSVTLSIENSNKNPLGNLANIDLNKGDLSKLSDIYKFIITVTDKQSGKVTKSTVEVFREYKSPFKLVKSILQFMQMNPDGYTIDNGYYNIDLLKYITSFKDKKIPLFKYKPTEFRFSILIRSVKTALRGSAKDMVELRKYPIEFLRNLYTKINSKLSLNLSLVEVIVASYVVNGNVPGDYRIVRANEEGAVVASTKDVIRPRTIGTAYGWDDIKNKVMLSSVLYIPEYKLGNVMDVLFKPNEILNVRKEK